MVQQFTWHQVVAHALVGFALPHEELKLIHRGEFIQGAGDIISRQIHIVRFPLVPHGLRRCRDVAWSCVAARSPFSKRTCGSWRYPRCRTRLPIRSGLRILWISLAEEVSRRCSRSLSHCSWSCRRFSFNSLLIMWYLFHLHAARSPDRSSPHLASVVRPLVHSSQAYFCSHLSVTTRVSASSFLKYLRCS